MKISRYIMITLSALILTGCGADGDEALTSPREMQFAASYPATRATDTAFEKGDKMGIYVTEYEGEKAPTLLYAGNYANNIPTEYDGAAWKCLVPIYWKEGKFDVYAYYPYAKPESVTDYAFKVSTDQSTAEKADTLSGYEASDLLFASAKGVTQTDVIPLTFRHCMSKFVVNIVKGPEYEGALPEDMEVFVHNTYPNALVDMSCGVAERNVRLPRESIKARKVSVEKYEAIIVPQRVDDKLPLIEIVTQGVSYLVESRFVFKAGVQHTYNVTVNGSPDQMKIEIGGEVEGGWQ